MSELPEGVSVATLDAEPVNRVLRLANPLGVTSFGINKIVLAPRQRNPIHRHRLQEEVYVVLAGELTLSLEGSEHAFGAGAVVRVPPGVRRQMLNRGPVTVEVLALGSMVDHEHVRRDGEAYEDWSDTEPYTPQGMPLLPDLPA